MTIQGEAKRVSDHVVNTLARVIANAKAGNVQAVMIIVVTPDGASEVQFGGDAEYMPSVNLGLDMAKHTLLSRIVSAPGAARMNSGLVMPETMQGNG